MSQPFRFLHSADLHLGRRFGNIPEPLRGRLIEARHQILPRLAELARANGARDIFLAGDTFDSETPARPVWTQALQEIASDTSLRWWVLPGNHDSLAAEALWSPLIASAPANLHVLTTAQPIELTPEATLLPAPLTHRFTGGDPTQWMTTAATPDGHMRIGLAHGPVQEFSEDSRQGGKIAPDRAQQSGLDMLALGDWHGAMTLGQRTAYSGTPEADGFRHNGRGGCWLVELDGPRALPRFTRQDTGQFHWAQHDLTLVPGLDTIAALEAFLPPAGERWRDHLLKINVLGRTSLPLHRALSQRAEDLTPQFGYFSLNTQELAMDIETADLDTLASGGALREAADALAKDAQDPKLSSAGQRVASDALTRLFASLAPEDAPENGEGQT